MKMDKCEFDLKFENNCAILAISGRINGMTSKSFEDKIKEAFDSGNKFEKIIFDFKNVEYISSSGLRIILYTRKRLYSLFNDKEDYASRVVVKNVSDDIREIFDMTGFDTIVDLE